MRTLHGLLGAALAGLLAGCTGSPPDVGAPVKVTGTVTLNGQPLAAGTVELSPTERGRDEQFAVKGGTFERQFMPGKYKVAVTGAGVPAKYTKLATTDLAAEVTSSTTEVKLEMTK